MSDVASSAPSRWTGRRTAADERIRRQGEGEHGDDLSSARGAVE